MAGAVDAYNAAMSSLESRVLVSARKFRELGTGGESELEELRPTERVVRQLDIPALGPGRRGAA
jgi:DNA recombination protein RmuC